MLKTIRLDIHIILGILLLVFGVSWYLLNPFKKDFALSSIPIVTIDAEMPLTQYFSDKTILYFGYTECPTVCPMTLGTLANVLDKYDKPDVKVIFISLSSKDNVQMSYDYGKRYHKKISGIYITNDNIKLLGKWLNLQYSDAGDGDIRHSGNLYLFDKKKLSTVLPFGVKMETIVEELMEMKQ